MKTYTVLATFRNSPKDVCTYAKTFGPFTEVRQAEACLVQLSGQASCQGAEVQEVESSD